MYHDDFFRGKRLTLRLGKTLHGAELDDHSIGGWSRRQTSIFFRTSLTMVGSGRTGGFLPVCSPTWTVGRQRTIAASHYWWSWTKEQDADALLLPTMMPLAVDGNVKPGFWPPLSLASFVGLFFVFAQASSLELSFISSSAVVLVCDLHRPTPRVQQLEEHPPDLAGICNRRGVRCGRARWTTTMTIRTTIIIINIFLVRRTPTLRGTT
jgi:hypothetical protein